MGPAEALISAYGIWAVGGVAVTGILVWLIAHVSAAPGTSVRVLWGLVEYTKSSLIGRGGKVDVIAGETKNISPPIQKIRFEPPSDFKLLPQQYTVDLVAQLPYVEVRFFAINFLPRPITLVELDLSLRLPGSADLELIPSRPKYIQIDQMDAPIICCRRNLTDAEIKIMPQKAGRESASFQLLVKAKDGEKNLTYGPVSSMVIDGWVNVLPTSKDKPRAANRI